MRIEIPGAPIALKRPRFGSGRVYDIQTHDKGVVKLFMRSKCYPCLAGYFKISMMFIFSSHDALGLWNIEKPTNKDLDNLIKFVLDVGNEVLWKDDRLAIAIEAKKIYGPEAKTILEYSLMKKASTLEEQVLKSITPSDFLDLQLDIDNTILSWKLEDMDLYHGDLAKDLHFFAKKWGPILNKIAKLKIE